MRVLEGVGVESLVAWGDFFICAVTFSSTSFRSCLALKEIAAWVTSNRSPPRLLGNPGSDLFQSQAATE